MRGGKKNVVCNAKLDVYQPCVSCGKEHVPVGDWDAKRRCSCVEECGSKSVKSSRSFQEDAGSELEVREGIQERCLLVCAFALDESSFALGRTKGDVLVPTQFFTFHLLLSSSS